MTVINPFENGPGAMPGLAAAEPSAADSPAIVTNTGTQRPSRRRFMGGAVGLAALGSFAVACGGPGTIRKAPARRALGLRRQAAAPRPSRPPPLTRTW